MMSVEKRAFSPVAAELLDTIKHLSTQEVDQLLAVARGKPSRLLPYERERIPVSGLCEVQAWRMNAFGDVLVMGVQKPSDELHTLLVCRAGKKQFVRLAIGDVSDIGFVHGTDLTFVCKRPSTNYVEFQYADWRFSGHGITIEREVKFWDHNRCKRCLVMYTRKGEEGLFVDLLHPGMQNDVLWDGAGVLWSAHIKDCQGVIAHSYEDDAILMVKRNEKWHLWFGGRYVMTPGGLDPYFFHFDRRYTYFYMDSHVLQFDGLPENLDVFEVVGGKAQFAHQKFVSGEHVFVQKLNGPLECTAFFRLDYAWCVHDEHSPLLGEDSYIPRNIFVRPDGEVFVHAVDPRSQNKRFGVLIHLCGKTSRLRNMPPIRDEEHRVRLMHEVMVAPCADGHLRIHNEDESAQHLLSKLQLGPCSLDELVEQHDGSFMAVHHNGGGEISVFRWPAELFQMKKTPSV
jgi:hypothetical protein